MMFSSSVSVKLGGEAMSEGMTSGVESFPRECNAAAKIDHRHYTPSTAVGCPTKFYMALRRSVSDYALPQAHSPAPPAPRGVYPYGRKPPVRCLELDSHL